MKHSLRGTRILLYYIWKFEISFVYKQIRCYGNWRNNQCCYFLYLLSNGNSLHNFKNVLVVCLKTQPKTCWYSSKDWQGVSLRNSYTVCKGQVLKQIRCYIIFGLFCYTISFEKIKKRFLNVFFLEQTLIDEEPCPFDPSAFVLRSSDITDTNFFICQPNLIKLGKYVQFVLLLQSDTTDTNFFLVYLIIDYFLFLVKH